MGYLIWSYPTSILLTRLPVAGYLSVNTLFWGLAVLSTAFARSFIHLLVCRFLLGITEATITPAFVRITAVWYPRELVPARTAMWFSGNALGGLLAGFYAWAVGSIAKDGQWRWMFGVSTIDRTGER